MAVLPMERLNVRGLARVQVRSNTLGHREIFRALKPGGVFFATYVNEWALDGFRQFVLLQRLSDSMLKSRPRYHVEFETVAFIEKTCGRRFSEH